jgi:hypothetical protein
MSIRCVGVALLVAVAGSAWSERAVAQPQESVGATLRYEVALPGGVWGSSIAITPGQRVEWRAVVSFTGTQPAVGLGSLLFQPVLFNVDNAGAGSGVDELGAFRAPPNNILSALEGQTTDSLATYGRVVYGTGTNVNLLGHRHSGGSNGAPPGDFIRVALAAGTQWYGPSGSGSFADSVNAINNNSIAGTQDVVLFRQAFIASDDLLASPRLVRINTEAGSMRRAGGVSGLDDTRFMTWAAAGESGTTASIRVGVEFQGADILIVPSPATGMLALGVLVAWARRRRA